VATVSAEPDSVLVAAGRSLRFRQPFVDPDSVAAYAPLVLVQRDASGAVLPPEPFTFESSDTTVVTVTDTALVGHAPGELTVLDSDFSGAGAISSRGKVAAGFATGGSGVVATLWSGGEETVLQPLRGTVIDQATMVDTAGVVAGFARYGYAGPETPVIWRDGLVARADDLVLGPWTILGLADLNEAGQLVGYGRNTETGAESAVLLTPR
jgi:hypothetical protein